MLKGLSQFFLVFLDIDRAKLMSYNEFVILNGNNKYPENYFVFASSLANAKPLCMADSGLFLHTIISL
jgi:hypothetical protein